MTELEVFTGRVFSNTGIETKRQRIRSIRLSSEFNSIISWIMDILRPYGDGPKTLTGHETEHDTLALCLACVYVGGEERNNIAEERYPKRKCQRVESFKIVSACALLAEMATFESEKRESEAAI